jgi:hypothetical protein
MEAKKVYAVFRRRSARGKRLYLHSLAMLQIHCRKMICVIKVRVQAIFTVRISTIIVLLATRVVL